MLSILITLFFFLLVAILILSQSSYGLYFGHDMTIVNYKQVSLLSPEHLTATEKGDVYVVWVDKNNISFASSYDNETKFRSKSVLTNINEFTLSPQITATEKGDVYVVWAEINNKTGDSNIEFISSNNSGMTFSPKKELSSGKSIYFSPQMAVTEKGDLCAVRCGLT